MLFRIPVAFLIVALSAVVLFWWSMGRPVPMPPSPLAEGEKVPCLSYAPYRRGQSPFTEDIVISAEQIDDDLAHLATVTDCVRLYAVDQGLENVPALARKHGLKVILGLWLGREPEKNAVQIETAVQLANANADVVRMLVIGNEALLRGEISEERLGEILRSVKARVSVPTTYADVWEFWIRHRALAEFVDIVTVHILPYWEDAPVPASQAGAHIAEIRRHVGEVFPGKPILIGETGWPSEGRMRWGARATPAEQARVMHDIVSLQKEFGYDINLIEAFDQPWKRLLEGTVGGYWGLLDADTREPKFRWGEAVSNYPTWQRWAVLGGLVTILVFAAGAVAGRGRQIPASRWFAVAVLAAVSGSAIGAAVHMHAIGARTPLELARACVYLVLAAGGPVVGAAGLTRGTAPEPLARLFSRPDFRSLGTWLAVLVAAAAVVSLYFAAALVFDPRYREFATSTLAGPVAAVALLAFVSPRGGLGVSERVFGGLILASAIIIAIQERVSNWEALLFAGTLIILSGSLFAARAARERVAEAPEPAR